MKYYRKLLPGLLLLTLLAVVALPVTTSAKTEVYRLADDPFTHDQCYFLGDPIEGPAAYFGTDVCVHYESLNSVTTRIKTNKDGTEDIGWSLIQQGTARVTDYDTDETLYVGPFQVEEIGQDDGNDSGCLTTASDGVTPIAFLGTCDGLFTTVEFIRYHWKITGSKVYFFELRVDDPGVWCILDAHEVIYDGGACPGP